MKNLKRTMAAFIAAVMTTAATAIPAMAASVGDVSYTAPTGYAEDATLIAADYASYAYLTGNKTDTGVSIYDSLNVKRGTHFDKYISSAGSMTSVRGGNARYMEGMVCELPNRSEFDLQCKRYQIHILRAE